MAIDANVLFNKMHEALDRLIPDWRAHVPGIAKNCRLNEYHDSWTPNGFRVRIAATRKWIEVESETREETWVRDRDGLFLVSTAVNIFTTVWDVCGTDLEYTGQTCRTFLEFPAVSFR